MRDLYVIGAVVIVVVGIFTFMSFKMESLEADVAKAEAEVVKEKSKASMCNQALNTQSKEIEAQRIDYEARLKAYANIKPEVKYKTIYRDVVREVNLTKESNCEDTKAIIDGIRNTDINGL